jgi:putative DNA primase/helicase
MNIYKIDEFADRDDAGIPEYSEEALALAFAQQHAGALRHVAVWSKWMTWTGQLWRLDNTLKAFGLARILCREAAGECGDEKQKDGIASASTVAAIERLAKADRRLAATTEQWDADPWLLNTPGGVVDLRTGKCRSHAPADYMTKITAVEAAARPTPTWLEFLERVTGGNVELIAFLQRVAGYALTGETTEHAMFFLYGVGANGKSTFINAITEALSDYHRTAPMETFTASKSERHPTDLAGLRGARLVTAIETEEGRHWDEAKVKALTGGDKIAARFMRQDFFEYTPQFKLLIAGNHKPGLKSVDEAIRRRLHLIPFTVTIPPAERDTQLADKLRAESAGILQWMIEGCLKWQGCGLSPPEAVMNATSDYLEAEDAIAAWIIDCCERDKQAWASSAQLFASWSTWSERTGEFTGSQKRFAQRLESRGIKAMRKRDGRGFVGLRLQDWT